MARIRVLKSRVVEVRAKILPVEARESFNWHDTDPGRAQPSHIPLEKYMGDLDDQETQSEDHDSNW